MFTVMWPHLLKSLSLFFWFLYSNSGPCPGPWKWSPCPGPAPTPWWKVLVNITASIRTPSLKFVGLAVRKIRRTMCVTINGPGDPDLWPFDLETAWESHLRWGTFLPNLGTPCLWVLELCLFAMYATDGQKQRLLPFPYGDGDIIRALIALKTVWWYVKLHRYNTGAWQTHRRTDGQNSCINIPLNRLHFALWWLSIYRIKCLTS